MVLIVIIVVHDPAAAEEGTYDSVDADTTKGCVANYNDYIDYTDPVGSLVDTEFVDAIRIFDAVQKVAVATDSEALASETTDFVAGTNLVADIHFAHTAEVVVVVVDTLDSFSPISLVCELQLLAYSYERTFPGL